MSSLKPPLPTPSLPSLPSLPSAPSTPPSPPSPSSDPDSVARPSAYRHQPRARPSPFEEYYGHEPRQVAILAELKSDRLDGVYNLSFLLLTFSLAYLVVRNVFENGFLPGARWICLGQLARDLLYSAAVCALYPPAFVMSYLLVRMHSRGGCTVHAVVFLHAVSLVALFAGMSVVMFWVCVNPIFSLSHGIVTVVVALKTHSFVFTNMLMADEMARRRRARRGGLGGKRNPSTASVSSMEKKEARKVMYPTNVTPHNMLYFVVAPTLVYETSYPRTECIRKRYVAWYSLQALLCICIQYILLAQFCIPIWQSSIPSERGLWWFCVKLALPTNCMWLLMFWGFFHCSLNVIAEFTRFADRQFYREWWNATTLNQFWRTWNCLVHEWCLRHLYVDSVNNINVTRETAAFATFFMSAVMHEFVCVIGFRMVRPYMFVGMMMQLPMMHFSERWSGMRKGNMVMWITLFAGQSFVMLIYVRDYLLLHSAAICTS